MRYLELVVLVLAFGLITPAFAQNNCCPDGCVQNAPNSCVTTGPTQNSCGTTFACPGGSGNSSGKSSGPGSGQFPAGIGAAPQCIALKATQAEVDVATNKCVSDLTGSAQLVGCFFEDDAGRAEDQRTGLSCPARQAALAKQCHQRCAEFASFSLRRWCVGQDANLVWHIFFGDIAGDTVGSARVDLCGPKLRASLFSRTMRLRPRPYMP
jgi:hypothetical protein